MTITEEIEGPYRCTVRARPPKIGGGWRLRACETMPGGEGVELPGGIFSVWDNPIRPGILVGEEVPPPGSADLVLAAAHEWLPNPNYRAGEHYTPGCFARNATILPGE